MDNLDADDKRFISIQQVMIELSMFTIWRPDMQIGDSCWSGAVSL